MNKVIKKPPCPQNKTQRIRRNPTGYPCSGFQPGLPVYATTRMEQYPCNAQFNNMNNQCGAYNFECNGEEFDCNVIPIDACQYSPREPITEQHMMSQIYYDGEELNNCNVMINHDPRYGSRNSSPESMPRYMTRELSPSKVPRQGMSTSRPIQQPQHFFRDGPCNMPLRLSSIDSGTNPNNPQFDSDMRNHNRLFEDDPESLMWNNARDTGTDAQETPTTDHLDREYYRESLRAKRTVDTGSDPFTCRAKNVGAGPYCRSSVDTGTDPHEMVDRYSVRRKNDMISIGIGSSDRDKSCLHQEQRCPVCSAVFVFATTKSYETPKTYDSLNKSSASRSKRRNARSYVNSKNIDSEHKERKIATPKPPDENIHANYENNKCCNELNEKNFDERNNKEQDPNGSQTDNCSEDGSSQSLIDPYKIAELPSLNDDVVYSHSTPVTISSCSLTCIPLRFNEQPADGKKSKATKVKILDKDCKLMKKTIPSLPIDFKMKLCSDSVATTKFNTALPKRRI